MSLDLLSFKTIDFYDVILMLRDVIMKILYIRTTIPNNEFLPPYHHYCYHYYYPDSYDDLVFISAICKTPCKNGGVCRDPARNTCTCQTGFYGNVCQFGK